MNIINEIDDWIKKEYEKKTDPYFHVHDLMRMLGELRRKYADEATVLNPVDENVMLRNDIQTLRDMTELQCSNGNWNYDPYMHGMANGLIFALSIFDKEEPKYLNAPKEWLADKPEPKGE